MAETEVETGSVLLSGAMLHKSLIQFFVDGWGCVPSLLFDLRPNYGGGNEDNGAQPCSRLALTHASTGDSWTLIGKSGSVFCWGHCSFPLGPGAHKILFVSSKSLFLQSCVSSGGFMVGLMATSSKRVYAIPRSTEPRAPAPADPYLHRRHSNTVLVHTLWVLWILVCTRFV